MSEYVKFPPLVKMQNREGTPATLATPATFSSQSSESSRSSREVPQDMHFFERDQSSESSRSSEGVSSNVHFSLCAVCGGRDWIKSLHSPAGWHCAHCGTPRSTEAGAPPRPGRVGRYQAPCPNCGETWYWPGNGWACSGCVVSGKIRTGEQEQAPIPTPARRTTMRRSTR